MLKRRKNVSEMQKTSKRGPKAALRAMKLVRIVHILLLDVAIDAGLANIAKNIICTVCKQAFVSKWVMS